MYFPEIGAIHHFEQRGRLAEPEREVSKTEHAVIPAFQALRTQKATQCLPQTQSISSFEMQFWQKVAKEYIDPENIYTYVQGLTAEEVEYVKNFNIVMLTWLDEAGIDVNELNIINDGTCLLVHPHLVDEKAYVLKEMVGRFIGNRILLNDPSPSVSIPVSEVSQLLQDLNLVDENDPYSFLLTFKIGALGDVSFGREVLAHVATSPDEYMSRQILKPGDILFTKGLKIHEIPYQKRSCKAILMFIIHTIIEFVQWIFLKYIMGESSRKPTTVHAALAIEANQEGVIDILEALPEGLFRTPSPQDDNVIRKDMLGTHQGRWVVYREPNSDLAKRISHEAQKHLIGETHSTGIRYNYWGVAKSALHSAELKESGKATLLRLVYHYQAKTKFESRFCSEFTTGTLQVANFLHIIEKLDPEIRRNFDPPAPDDSVTLEEWVEGLLTLQEGGKSLFDEFILDKLHDYSRLDSPYVFPMTLEEGVVKRINAFLFGHNL